MVHCIKQVSPSLFSSSTQFTYEVLSCESITNEVSRILLQSASEEHLIYQAGQYLHVVHSDGRISPLSIACSPRADQVLELHLSHPAHNVLANQILYSAQVEKKLRVQGPYGRCTAAALYSEQPLIFLARGTGFAPVKALLEVFQTFHGRLPLYLYWGATFPEELYLHKLAVQWMKEITNFFYVPVLSRQHPTWQGKTGLLQQIILQEHPDLKNYRIYASASQEIVRTAFDDFLLVGFPSNQFFSDVLDWI